MSQQPAVPFVHMKKKLVRAMDLNHRGVIQGQSGANSLKETENIDAGNSGKVCLVSARRCFSLEFSHFKFLPSKKLLA